MNNRERNQALRTHQRLLRQLLGRDGCMDRSCILRDPEAPPALGRQFTNGGCSCLKDYRSYAWESQRNRIAEEV